LLIEKYSVSQTTRVNHKP
jgi:hypothetical protein